MRDRKRGHGNYAGLLEMRRNRRTGAEIGLYRSEDAGIESDPHLPYATVCETHGMLVCHEKLTYARSAMAYPDWCDECRNRMG